MVLLFFCSHYAKLHLEIVHFNNDNCQVSTESVIISLLFCCITLYILIISLFLD